MDSKEIKKRIKEIYKNLGYEEISHEEYLSRIDNSNGTQDDCEIKYEDGRGIFMLYFKPKEESTTFHGENFTFKVDSKGIEIRESYSKKMWFRLELPKNIEALSQAVKKAKEYPK